jgi:hypothetical protein
VTTTVTVAVLVIMILGNFLQTYSLSRSMRLRVPGPPGRARAESEFWTESDRDGSRHLESGYAIMFTLLPRLLVTVIGHASPESP